MDECVDVSHPYLKDFIWQNTKDPVNGIDDDGNGLIDDSNGWNFATNTGLAGITLNSDWSHGTLVGGIASHQHPSLKLMSLCMMSADSKVNLLNEKKAINYSGTQKASVANYSYEIISTYSSPNYYYRTTFEENPQTLMVVAAGNHSRNLDILPNPPAGCGAKNMIVVAATDRTRSFSPFSNYSTAVVDVAAPGVNLVSTSPNNEFVLVSGTSFAAPYVSHVAARVRAINPKLEPLQTKKIILETVDVKGFLKDKVRTSGIVNLTRAEVAAEFSVSMPLEQAILGAKNNVKDMD